MEEERGDGEGRSLMEVFATVPDPRDAHGLRHPLGAILGLAVCAMLCGARSLYAISQMEVFATVPDPRTRSTAPVGGDSRSRMPYGTGPRESHGPRPWI